MIQSYMQLLIIKNKQLNYSDLISSWTFYQIFSFIVK